MHVTELAHPWLEELVAYEPGKPIEETARELGLRPEEISKLASNENPLGPSPRALEALGAFLSQLHLYPDGGGYRLREALARRNGLERSQVVLGNGSNEIIELLCHAFLGPGKALVAAEHAFVVYRLMAQLFGGSYQQVADPGLIHDLPAMREAITPETRLVFVANPNNPTGTVVPPGQIEEFVRSLPDHVVAVFDEAYYEFLPDPPDLVKYVREGCSVVVMRTFSKAYGLAGLRVGYGLMPERIADLLNRARQPFNVNAASQVAALAALEDEEHLRKTVENNAVGLRLFEETFAKWGLEFVPSVANFSLVRTEEGDRVFAEMLKRGVIVRAMRGYGLPDWIRLSVGTPSQNERALACLQEVLSLLG